MSKSGLHTFTYWTALPTLAVALVAGCSDDSGPAPMPLIPEDAGVSPGDSVSSESPPDATSGAAATGPRSSSTASPSPTGSSEPPAESGTFTEDVGIDTSPMPSPPLAVDPSSFPVGLAVESLLSRRDPLAGPSLLRWRDQSGNETSASEQIVRALAATSAADCAVKLPPLTPAVSPSCYGPALEYANHPDGECRPPMESAGYCRFPSGDLGMWSANEGETQEACTAAKFNADVNTVGLRVDAALVVAASAVCALARDGMALPLPGDDVDATAVLQQSLQVHQPGISVSSATITNVSDGGPESTFLYVVESSYEGQTLRYSLRHNTSGGATYTGRLWGEVVRADNPSPLTSAGSLQAYVVGDGGTEFVEGLDAGAPPPPPAPECESGPCAPPCDGPNCPVPPPPAPCDGGACPPCLGPDCPEQPPLQTCDASACLPPMCQGAGCPPPPPCTGETCPPPPCTGEDCPAPGGPLVPLQGGNAEVFSVTYELTDDAHLRTRMVSKHGAVGGDSAFTPDGQLAPSGAWTSSMSLTALDVDQTTDTGKGAYLWQAGPHDDRTRVFNVFTELDGEGEKTGCGFFGYGAPFGSALPGLGIENFICNWAGPNNDHGGLAHFAQKQCMAPNAYGLWQATESWLAYAPTNSCRSDDEAFAGGPMNSTPSEWTAFAAESALVDLSSDEDYTSGFASGPVEPTL